MNENKKNPNDPRQETHSDKAVDTANHSITSRILDGMLKMYDLGNTILEALQNLTGAVARLAEAEEGNNKYLRNISDTCDEWKAHEIDNLDFRSQLQEYVYGLYTEIAVSRDELIRLNNGLKDGKFEI